MIRATQTSFDGIDLSPQAVFSRPIFFFTLSFTKGDDDLDLYEGADFCLNNDTLFCLRHYSGHPPRTVTLYLDSLLRPTEIKSISDLIITGFHLPLRAVRWRRGEPYEFGTLRPEADRLREAEARDIALKIAASLPNCEASSKYIKERAAEYVHLTAKDLEPAPSRPREKKWQQVVGNVVSHSKSAASIFSKGYAERTEDGIRLTNHGINYLNDMGYSTKRAL